MLLFVFVLAAVLFTAISRSILLRQWCRLGPHCEGIAFAAAVLASAIAGLLLTGTAPHLGSSLSILGLTAAIGVLAAVRGVLAWPLILADLVVVLAAIPAAVMARHELLPVTSNWAWLPAGLPMPLLIVWIWAIARMTAGLNRVPQVTGGYLGIVALGLFFITKVTQGAMAPFPAVVSMALAGAGLATLPLALRRPEFNLGWSTSLALGYLLSQVAAIGLLHHAVYFVLTLSLMAFGLPLLEMTTYQMTAAWRGQKLDGSEGRLHDALLRRGLSPAKIALIYLALGGCLCGLGILTAWLFSSNFGFSPLFVLVRILLLASIIAVGFIVFLSVTRVLMRRGASEVVPADVEVFGVRISAVSMAEAMETIDAFISSRIPHHVVTSDANAILKAQEDAEYAGILRQAHLVTPDGYGVVWAARLFNLPVYERVTGVDMVTGICRICAREGYSIYILGSAPGIAATAAEKLAEQYPGMKIAGTQHGYFKPEEEEAVVRQIRDARPDVLFVAFGIPKQEKFIARHLEQMNVPVSVGVGGSFDVYSEKLRRAPAYVQRSGMEWLYRVWQEPARWKRMSYVPRFMALTLKTWIMQAGRSGS